eukprot:917-Heterococcus_DN1.PRE.1
MAHSLAKVYTALLNEPELLHEQSWRVLRAAALTGIGPKPRPIACSGIWRRLMASIAAKAVAKKLAPVLMELSQFGVGVSAGVEHVAMEARLWHELYGVVVQLDCVNAFNSVDRLAIVRGLERFCPELLPYFDAVYCGDNMPELRAERDDVDANGLLTRHHYIVLSELGCQQGDPLGPILFAVALTNALHPEHCKGPGSTARPASATN